MSMDGTIRLLWGDRERTFRMGIGQFRAVWEKTRVTPEELAAHMAPSAAAMDKGLGIVSAAAVGWIGRYQADEVRETLYQALLAGEPDTPPHMIAADIEQLVDRRPLRQNVPIAYAIVVAGLDGVPDDPVGEGEGGVQGGTDSPPKSDPSASVTSTAPAPARRSRRRRSTS